MQPTGGATSGGPVQDPIIGFLGSCAVCAAPSYPLALVPLGITYQALPQCPTVGAWHFNAPQWGHGTSMPHSGGMAHQCPTVGHGISTPFSLEWDTPKVRWTRLRSRDPQDRFPRGPVSGLCAPDQAEHRKVTELSGGMGPSNHARTGGTLVGQPVAEGIGPLGRKRLRPSGVLARVNGGEEYRP